MLDEALSRTMLLMRTDLTEEATDAQLLKALTSTSIVLQASAAALATNSGQSAFITAATEMARSGHEIWLDAPDVPLNGPQPPMVSGTLIQGLLELGADLLPGIQFRTGAPEEMPDLVIGFGETNGAIALNASDWSAKLTSRPEFGTDWAAGEWPIGGLAAGCLAAGEAFKASMRKLRSYARQPALFDDLYAAATDVSIDLAPADMAKATDLGRFDIVSGGAIANCLLHALYRCPGLAGKARVMDDDTSALSNLNRNALLRRSRLDDAKVDDLASYGGSLQVEPLVHRYGAGGDEPILAPTVVVGVDHIPSRWEAQLSRPEWLGIAATERFSVQVSFHQRETACAQCLHPEDAPIDGPIPTAAFVSYWAGLLLAVSLLRKATGEAPRLDEQQVFFPALRPEAWVHSAWPVPKRDGCPTCAVLA